MRDDGDRLRTREELREWRDEASALLKKLQGRPVRERARAVRREARFHQPQLAELMLEKSRLEADARRSEELARLAFLVAVKAAPRIPADTAESLKARACCLLGNALCSQGRLTAADEAFRGAAFHLAGSFHSHERAVFCQRLARLRMNQERLDEALALLWRASYLYGDEGDFHEQSVCLTHGILLALGALEGMAVRGRKDSEAAAAMARRFLCRMKRRHGPAKGKQGHEECEMRSSGAMRAAEVYEPREVQFE